MIARSRGPSYRPPGRPRRRGARPCTDGRPSGCPGTPSRRHHVCSRTSPADDVSALDAPAFALELLRGGGARPGLLRDPLALAPPARPPPPGRAEKTPPPRDFTPPAA